MKLGIRQIASSVWPFSRMRRDEINFRHHWSSEIYGQGKAFRNIFRFPRWMPLLFTSDHGAALASDFDPSMFEFPKLLKFHITWSEPVADNIRRRSEIKGRVMLAPHPWLVYRKMSHIELLPNRVGTIFFAFHSSPQTRTPNLNDDKTIEYLKQLPDNQKPVTVCFYHPDLQTARAKIYEAAGFYVTSAGDTRAYDFVDNFYKLVSNYAFAISQGLGSQVVFCTEIGIPTQIINSNIKVITSSSSSIFQSQLDPILEDKSREARELFGARYNQVTPDQLAFARHALGYTYLAKIGRLRLYVYFVTALNFLPWLIMKTTQLARMLNRGNERDFEQTFTNPD